MHFSVLLFAGPGALIGGFIARYVAVATPEYLERNGSPLRPADLSSHDCVVYSGLRSAHEWRFQSPAYIYYMYTSQYFVIGTNQYMNHI